MKLLLLKLIWNSPSACLAERLPTRMILALRPRFLTASSTKSSATNFEWTYWLSSTCCPSQKRCSVSTTSLAGTPLTRSPAILTVEIWMSRLFVCRQKSISARTESVFTCSISSPLEKCLTLATQLMTVSSRPLKFLSASTLLISALKATTRCSSTEKFSSSK